MIRSVISSDQHKEAGRHLRVKQFARNAHLPPSFTTFMAHFLLLSGHVKFHIHILKSISSYSRNCGNANQQNR